jgi:mRNA interferase RelE/StbE
VTREVAFEDQALSQAADFLHDDSDGVRAIFEAVDRLLDDPEPAQSFPFGTAGLRRLHVGRYRILYRVTDDEIQVGHIGRLPAS